MFPSIDHPLFHHVRILHISDLHTGLVALAQHVSLIDKIKEHLKSITNGFHAMVVSGDVIDSESTKDEKSISTRKQTLRERYGSAKTLILGLAQAAGVSPHNIVVCPGNQDIVRDSENPYEEYVQFLNTIHEHRTPLGLFCDEARLISCSQIHLGKDGSVLLCAMNSNDGPPGKKDLLAQATDAQIKNAKELVENAGPKESSLRIIILHHCIGDTAITSLPEGDRSSVFNLREKIATKLSADFCLAGHIHHGITNHDQVPVISSSHLFPCTADESKGNPQFSILDLLVFPYVVPNRLAWALGITRIDFQNSNNPAACVHKVLYEGPVFCNVLKYKQEEPQKHGKFREIINNTLKVLRNNYVHYIEN